MHIAEDMNFDVLHGIVDSIWVKKRDGAANNDYTNLKETIKKETGFDVSFEGVYKWIAFLPSEINSHIPVLNRYFGVFEDGTIKTRGIEGRRHDTPDFLVQCQNEILEILAQGNSIQDIKQNKLSLIIKKIKDNLSLLKYRKVEPESLVFTKLLSKDYNQYHNRNTLENSAIKQLELNGEYLKAGQILQYVIMENNGPILKRVLPIQLLDNKTYYYDIKRYSELLIDTCNNIIKPFGIVFDQNQSVCRLDSYY